MVTHDTRNYELNENLPWIIPSTIQNPYIPDTTVKSESYDLE